jgi:PIN domain nuclease of toxin-antitoxin system
VRYLLDTHVVLWMLDDAPQLGPKVRDQITDPANDVYVSVVSLWEMALKIRIGKLEADIAEILGYIAPAGLRLLDLRPAHLLQLALLPVIRGHRDPFDHLLIATAQAERLCLVTGDAHVPGYAVEYLALSA